MMISVLYRIGNRGVFYSPIINRERNEIYFGLLGGSLVGYDVNNNIMDPADAGKDFLTMCDYPYGILNDVEKIYRNISLYSIFVSVVRSALLVVPNGASYLGKLSEVIGCVQTGMFDSASMLLTTIEPDEVLTEERLLIWASMLKAADAIGVE